MHDTVTQVCKQLDSIPMQIKASKKQSQQKFERILSNLNTETEYKNKAISEKNKVTQKYQKLTLQNRSLRNKITQVNQNMKKSKESTQMHVQELQDKFKSLSVQITTIESEIYPHRDQLMLKSTDNTKSSSMSEN